MNADPAASLASLLREQNLQGVPIDALQTLAARPDWWTNKSVVLDLAYEEFCQRREAGEHVDPDQFCKRFPVYQSSLRRTLEVHQLIQENPDRFAPLQWPQSGEEFLGFRLERELGRGAFARVFQATETAVGNRAVAVKISVQGAAEADTLGKLDHPNIVPILHVKKDESTGQTVVCMPYFGSTTLCDVLDRVLATKDVPWQADIDGVMLIALGITEAMAYMHARGICHHDLKPSNVLMTPDSRPMILDFNLALDAQKNQQQIGGTLPYMSPEQLLATDLDRPIDTNVVGALSDVFSFGVMLYELLTGAHPFGPIPLKLTSQDLRKVLLERQQELLPSIRQRNRCVDRSVAKIIERCLAYNPRERPSAAELVQSFRASLSAWRRSRRWVARHRWSVLAGTTFLAAALVVIGWLAIPKGTASERAYARGLAEYNGGQWSRAVEQFGEAIAADEKYAPAILGRARAFQKLQRYDLASNDYGKLDASQQDGNILACMGYCTAQYRVYPVAQYFHEKAIAKGYETAVLHNNIGWCLLRMSELDRAEKSLTRALEMDERLQIAFHNRARVQRQWMTQQPGRLPLQGIADVRRAMELGPTTTDLAFDAAYLCTFAAKSDPKWITPALGYLTQAIRLGFDPKLVNTDVMFKGIAKEPGFAAALNTPPQQSRQDSSPLVDPLNDD